MDDIERAIQELEAYHHALRFIDELQDRVEILQSRCEQVTRAPDSRAGWTGVYIGKAKRKHQGTIESRDPRLLRNPEKVQVIPNISTASRDPKEQERKIIVLMLQKQELDLAKRAADAIFNRLDARIAALKIVDHRRILRFRYLNSRTLSFRLIAKKLNFDHKTIIKKYYEALEFFAKIKLEEENLGEN